MRTSMHPALFLAIAVAVSAAVLWSREPDRRPPPRFGSQPAAAAAVRAPARPAVQVDAATLERHTGRYDFEGTLVAIAVADGALIADGGTLGRYRLVAVSDTRFYLADGVGEVTFSGDDGGHSARFTADLPNGRYTAPRVAER